MPGKMARSDPRPSVQVTRGAGSGQHLASVLQKGRENVNIDAGLGFISRISGYNWNRRRLLVWDEESKPSFGHSWSAGLLEDKGLTNPSQSGSSRRRPASTS